MAKSLRAVFRSTMNMSSQSVLYRKLRMLSFHCSIGGRRTPYGKEAKGRRLQHSRINIFKWHQHGRRESEHRRKKPLQSNCGPRT
jgi:hypothetical protein